MQKYYIICLDGARACPLEDVGGVVGYNEFCNILNDPDHENYENSREWAGIDYDSEKFDADEINWELMKYLRWSRNRYLRWRDIY